MIVKIEIYNDGKMWCARGVGEDSFIQGQTLDELYINISEAASLHFDNRFRQYRAVPHLALCFTLIQA